MITLSVEPANTYSCQNCGRVYETAKEELIEQEFYPVCSSKCGFMVVYNFLKNSQLNDETLLEMQIIAENKEEIKDFKRSSAIYSISKYYLKQGLANIKFLSSFRQALSKVRQDMSLWTFGHSSTCMKYKGMSKPCPSESFCQTSNLSKSNTKKGVISKWF